MKRIKLDGENKMFIIDGKGWAITQRNLDALMRYANSENETVLRQLSGVVLDSGKEVE